MNNKQMEISRWLDNLAFTVKTLKDFDTLEIDGETFNVCPHCQHGVHNKPYIQLYNCLRRIAEIMGFEIKVNEDYDTDARLLTFEYEGVDFTEVEDK